MSFKIGLCQMAHPEESAEFERAVVAKAAQWFDDAAAQGVELLVFPESLMTRYEEERAAFMAAAQPLGGSFCAAMNELACAHGMWCVYTANEANPEGAPFNTAVLVDGEGVVRGVYRKTHLFDTNFTRESDCMSAGDRLFEPVDAPFGKIGLSICYDLRFPEVARTAALHGCQLLVNPAAWVAGPNKVDQWSALAQARAIENEMFVAALSRTGSSYIGSSLVVSPDGTVLARGGKDEELLVADVDLAEIDRVRAAMPVFAHRRPELYGALAHPNGTRPETN